MASDDKPIRASRWVYLGALFVILPVVVQAAFGCTLVACAAAFAVAAAITAVSSLNPAPEEPTGRTNVSA